tara:strand:+ start:266 stop:1078 length:813 start_codon:yes stop_codon:yes gene_type:complete
MFSHVLGASIQWLCETLDRPTSNLQYNDFQRGVALKLSERGDLADQLVFQGEEVFPNDALSEVFREAFWHILVRGIIMPGINVGNPSLPWFKLTSYGESHVRDAATLFHDEASFVHDLETKFPAIPRLAVSYAGEAMKAYRSDCLRSSAVMLGVSLETIIDFLLESTCKSEQFAEHFSRVKEEPSLLRRIHKFQAKLQEVKRDVPRNVLENTDVLFEGISAIIRTSRNEAGHPTNVDIPRDLAFANMRLFVSFCEKIYAYVQFFEGKDQG